MAHPLPSQMMSTCTDGFFYCLAQWVYLVTEGVGFIMFLLGFVIVLFIITSRFGTSRAFGFAGFGSLIGGIWLAIMNLILWDWAVFFILGGMLGIIAMVVSERM